MTHIRKHLFGALNFQDSSAICQLVDNMENTNLIAEKLDSVTSVDFSDEKFRKISRHKCFKSDKELNEEQMDKENFSCLNQSNSSQTSQNMNSFLSYFNNPVSGKRMRGRKSPGLRLRNTNVTPMRRPNARSTKKKLLTITDFFCAAKKTTKAEDSVDHCSQDSGYAGSEGSQQNFQFKTPFGSPLRRFCDFADKYSPCSPWSPSSEETDGFTEILEAQSKVSERENNVAALADRNESSERCCRGLCKVRDELLPCCSKRPKFFRSLSANEVLIKTAVHRSSCNPDLIGDFSKACVLPLVDGKNKDLRNISCETLVRLLAGGYEDVITNYMVIDCRYPYEYAAGHIRGAVNMYTTEQVADRLLRDRKSNPSWSPDVKRRVLVFHCEFSSERGPNMFRFLRNSDRELNKDVYPRLHWPELYLLEGGYKEFFTRFPILCEPRGYTPMLHPSHRSDLRHFRARSKSWNGSSKHKRHRM